MLVSECRPLEIPLSAINTIKRSVRHGEDAIGKVQYSLYRDEKRFALPAAHPMGVSLLAPALPFPAPPPPPALDDPAYQIVGMVLLVVVSIGCCSAFCLVIACTLGWLDAGTLGRPAAIPYSIGRRRLTPPLIYQCSPGDLRRRPADQLRRL